MKWSFNLESSGPKGGRSKTTTIVVKIVVGLTLTTVVGVGAASWRETPVPAAAAPANVERGDQTFMLSAERDITLALEGGRASASGVRTEDPTVSASCDGETVAVRLEEVHRVERKWSVWNFPEPAREQVNQAFEGLKKSARSADPAWHEHEQNRVFDILQTIWEKQRGLGRCNGPMPYGFRRAGGEEQDVGVPPPVVKTEAPEVGEGTPVDAQPIRPPADAPASAYMSLAEGGAHVVIEGTAAHGLAGVLRQVPTELAAVDGVSDGVATVFLVRREIAVNPEEFTLFAMRCEDAGVMVADLSGLCLDRGCPVHWQPWDGSVPGLDQATDAEQAAVPVDGRVRAATSADESRPSTGGDGAAPSESQLAR